MRGICSGSAAVWVTALLVCACAGPPKPGQVVPTKHDVREVVAQFAEDLRWGRYDRAARLVHPERRPVFRNWIRRNGERLRFTSYEIERVARGATIDEVIAQVSFTLYHLPRVEQRTVMVSQHWRFDAGWYLDPDLSAFSGAESPEVGSSSGGYSDR